MLVHHFLENSSDRFPDKAALVCEGRRWTYRELEAQANRVARALAKTGVKRGDRVGICLRNSAEAVASIFGILKAGAVFVYVNPTIKRDKLEYILNNCQAAALIFDSRTAAADLLASPVCPAPSLQGAIFCGPDPEARKACPIPLSPWIALEKTFPDERPRSPTIDVDLACLIYTSGTTGDPKGVVSDHSNMVFASGSIIEYLGMRSDDIIFNVLPLSFDYGLYQLLMTFRVGGTLVLENSFAYPASILNQIAKEKVTGFPGVPTLFEMILRLDLNAFDLSHLRFLTNTAAALPPSRVMDLRTRFPKARVFSMYGLTETKRTLYMPPEWLDRKPGSVGIAIPGTEVWIEDEQGNRLGPGKTGELVSRGRHVMRGYWMAEEATAKRFRPGPLPGERVCHTGDLFSMDEEGCFYFVARKDDVIKSRGEKVAPKEVENVIYGLKGVREVAVLGVPDPLLGQAVKALVVVDDPGVTAAAVLAHCRAHLEDFMVPKQVEFRASLPKTESGKIARKELA
ncbi:MAG: AMP-binding protein [Verrucomicrobia bacterium]|nr:AMP-binding protein [Verrucomicrobiota bacterium]MBI3870803.1 AMP-binding protein [Verrucomicrobiota bacterium]